MSPCFVHLTLTGFFVAAERSLHAELEGRPLVIGGRPGSPARVVAASAEADGIVPGQTVRSAAARRPDAVFVEGTLSDYLAVSTRVRREVASLASRVQWTSITEADLELPDARGGLAAGAALADRLAATVRRTLAVDVACGVGTSLVVARVAGRMARPRGLITVLAGYEARVLSAARVEWLDGVDTTLAAKLRANGIATLGALAAGDPDRVRRVAGRAAPVLQDLSRGVDPRRVVVPGTARVRPTPRPMAHARLAELPLLRRSS